MTKQLSFTKIENELLPDFRNKIGMAESTEDVKKHYIYTLQELFRRVFSGKLKLGYDDVVVRTGIEPSFTLTEQFLSKEDFRSVWNTSDLPHVVSRFTETAVNHYKRLDKNPEKTKLKIRM